MKIPYSLLVLLIVCLVFVELSECKAKKKGKKNKKVKKSKAKPKKQQWYVPPPVKRPPLANAMTPCMIIKNNGEITIPATCPSSTKCAVGPIQRGNGVQHFRCTFPAVYPCWTMYMDGTTKSAPCPKLWTCSEGPYGSVLKDGTHVIVKQCSNTPIPPCSVTYKDESTGNCETIQPITCNSNCSLGPFPYKHMHSIHSSAYYCDADLGSACQTDYLDGTVETSDCPEGKECNVGPFKLTAPDGRPISATYCNSSYYAESCEDENDSDGSGSNDKTDDKSGTKSAKSTADDSDGSKGSKSKPKKSKASDDTASTEGTESTESTGSTQETEGDDAEDDEEEGEESDDDEEDEEEDDDEDFLPDQGEYRRRRRDVRAARTDFWSALPRVRSY